MSFDNLMIFFYTDLIEISIIACALYFFTLWLYNDKQKNLLATFYCSLTIFYFAYFSQMYVLTNIFLYFWPLFLTIFILLHQNILQKNFISFKKIKPKLLQNNNWIEILMRSCLNSMSKNKDLTIIIEQEDSIKEHLKAPFYIESIVNKELLDLLINSSSFENNNMIWINKFGFINSVNAQWNIKNNQLLFEDSTPLELWQQNAIIFTTKFDAIALKTNSEKHSFTLIINGKTVSDLALNNAFTLINQIVRRNEINLENKNKEIYEAKSPNNKFKQPVA